MTILNLTQHHATPEQKDAGVVDIPEQQRALLIKLLTFEHLPDAEDVHQRAISISELITEADAILHPGSEELVTDAVMIGGAPYLMPYLERHCGAYCTVLYAFSIRESVEQTQPDGSVRKVNIFRHGGFIKAEGKG